MKDYTLPEILLTVLIAVGILFCLAITYCTEVLVCKVVEIWQSILAADLNNLIQRT
jgi:hypothetical protein